MRSDESGQTLVARTFDQLKNLILTGGLRPGDPLRPGDLGARLGVSPTVVREALARLVSDNLIEHNLHRGFRVRTLSKADLDDLTRVRIEIECKALEWALAVGDLRWESGVVAALHLYSATLESAESSGGPDDLGIAHERLHEAMVAACESQRLLTIRSNLVDEAEMYRRWTRYRPDVKRDVLGEHRELADACLDRDVEAAVRSMAAHITRTADLLVTYLVASEDGPGSSGPSSEAEAEAG